MGESDYSRYYKEKLETGLIYQDFIMEALYNFGFPISNYCSNKYQIMRGENKAGIEIKYDELFATTRNLYIETAEKSDPKNKNYVKSGIYRNDNSWLWSIGNYEENFIFLKKILKLLHVCTRDKNSNERKFREVENSTKTSLGFLIPEEDARRYARVLVFKEKKLIEINEPQKIEDINCVGKMLREKNNKPKVAPNQMNIWEKIKK